MLEKRGDTANGVSDKLRSGSSRAKPGFAFQTGQDDGKEREKNKKTAENLPPEEKSTLTFLRKSSIINRYYGF